METLSIIQISVGLLTLAAFGGIILAGLGLTGRSPPIWLAMGHGFAAGAALTLLIYAWFMFGLPQLALFGTGLLMLAALGGVVLNLKYHWNRLAFPKWLIYVHALFAVAGYILLFTQIFGQ